MAIHPGQLLAYDADGNVTATLDYLVQYDDQKRPLGLVDFAAHEENGGAMTDVWNVAGAAGSKVWPEYLGAAAHQYRVEKVGPAGQKKIGALVHKTSGHRRERATIEAAIAQRIADAAGGPADIRDLVGGPDRPLVVDSEGKTVPRQPRTRPNLPLRARGGAT